MTVRVAVIEDDALMRLSLVSALRNRGFDVSIDCGTASDAIELSEQNRFDVALIDLHLGPGPTGIDVARHYRRSNLGVGIVFLTSYEDPRLLSVKSSLMPSNSFYLNKKDVQTIDVLANTITAAASGKKAPRRSANSLIGTFSDAQIETLMLVAQGLSNAEIAKKRFITERSVEVAISRVAKALGLDINSSKNQRVHIAKVFFKATGNNANLD